MRRRARAQDDLSQADSQDQGRRAECCAAAALAPGAAGALDGQRPRASLSFSALIKKHDSLDVQRHASFAERFHPADCVTVDVMSWSVVRMAVDPARPSSARVVCTLASDLNFCHTATTKMDQPHETYVPYGHNVSRRATAASGAISTTRSGWTGSRNYWESLAATCARAGRALTARRPQTT